MWFRRWDTLLSLCDRLQKGWTSGCHLPCFLSTSSCRRVMSNGSRIPKRGCKGRVRFDLICGVLIFACVCFPETTKENERYLCVSTPSLQELTSTNGPTRMIPGLRDKRVEGPLKNAWTDDFGLFSGLDLLVVTWVAGSAFFFGKPTSSAVQASGTRTTREMNLMRTSLRKSMELELHLFVIETSTVSDSILFYIVGIHFVQQVYNEMSIGFWRLHLLPR